MQDHDSALAESPPWRDVEAICQDRDAGLTMRQLAAKYGSSPSELWLLMQARKYAAVPRKQRWKPLSAKQQTAIRVAYHRKGASIDQLARDFHAPPGAIWQAIRNRTNRTHESAQTAQ